MYERYISRTVHKSFIFFSLNIPPYLYLNSELSHHYENLPKISHVKSSWMSVLRRAGVCVEGWVRFVFFRFPLCLFNYQFMFHDHIKEKWRWKRGTWRTRSLRALCRTPPEQWPPRVMSCDQCSCLLALALAVSSSLAEVLRWNQGCGGFSTSDLQPPWQ